MRMLMGIWRVTGSTRLQNPAMRSVFVLSGTPSGWACSFASKFHGTVVVKFKLFELIKGVFSITSHTNAQENNMKSHSFCTGRSACCRCAASNCCPGPMSSQHLISIKCTCRWFTFSRWGCLTRLAVVVLSVGLCLLRNA
eukprot:419381-Pelagomonas_calceolata.AAC.1